MREHFFPGLCLALLELHQKSVPVVAHVRDSSRPYKLTLSPLKKEGFNSKFKSTGTVCLLNPKWELAPQDKSVIAEVYLLRLPLKETQAGVTGDLYSGCRI